MCLACMAASPLAVALWATVEDMAGLIAAPRARTQSGAACPIAAAKCTNRCGAEPVSAMPARATKADRHDRAAARSRRLCDGCGGIGAGRIALAPGGCSSSISSLRASPGCAGGAARPVDAAARPSSGVDFAEAGYTARTARPRDRARYRSATDSRRSAIHAAAPSNGAGAPGNSMPLRVVTAVVNRARAPARNPRDPRLRDRRKESEVRPGAMPSSCSMRSALPTISSKARAAESLAMA